MNPLIRFFSQPYAMQLLAAIVGIIVILIIRSFIEKRLNHYIKDSDSSYRTKKAVGIVGYFLIVLLISVVYRDRLGSLTVFFGIAGAGITFALQEVIVSFAGWLAILFSDIYKSGDRVQVGGIKGDVIDVGILRTTIMEIGGWVDGDLYNGRIVRIANSFVFKEPVYNYSADFPFLWDEIKIPVRFGSNYNMARQMFTEVANNVVGDYTKEAEEQWDQMVKKYLIEDAQTEPLVLMVANDNWVEFTVRYVVDYKKRLGIKDELFSHILQKVESSDGKVALASATFELVNTPTVNIKSDRKNDEA
ncbi:mechanosensitive ion channel protein MscS [Halolactibacillus miurensis]|uniref:Mechanosensitive ion channel protein MscS n=1 Tax=Halolactibacillus miurensis TaxID=306541 RepID=A0A1I6P2R7_9BACI|nr:MULTISPECIES: mechanosensitive ion channel domain-containing protein [Halolactibacillus]GEM03155.1 mechanosensitive ion channel protein MscS [Halolactibacillus miurensis]SFS34489.1 Small-conductance mechanosensitive channel [Halolactibacillus miurensis]